LALHVECQQLPLVRLSYEGAYSDDELHQFLLRVAAMLQLPGRKAAIIDLTKATPGTAKQRQMQGDWIKAHEEVVAREFVAAVIISDSAVIRGTVTAVFWIRPLPLPTEIVSTLEDAERWLAPYLLTLARKGRS
jgi:butyrate kinase